MSRITIIGADWCRPCKHLKKELPKVATELTCEIPIYYEEFEEKKHFVDKLPTTCMTIDGLEKVRFQGTDAANIKSFIRTAMAFDNIEAYGFEA